MGFMRLAFNAVAMLPYVTRLRMIESRLKRRALGTGGSVSSRYCYSVWLRHAVCSAQAGAWRRPRVVAELGPGDSLGLGISALLSGAAEYRAFDVVAHANVPHNLRVFEELVELFRARADIPDAVEFPAVGPRLGSYAFPTSLLRDELLAETLSEKNLQHIRWSLEHPGESGSKVQYVTPWIGCESVQAGSVDLIISQAVLEHIDEISSAYEAMGAWLSNDGWMSHQIDFCSHGWTKEWNGQWGCSDWYWKWLRGRDIWFINRAPPTTHRALLERAGFVTQFEQAIKRADGLAQNDLAARFRDMSADDLRTSELFFIATRSGVVQPPIRSDI
jgi:hypothetical protein